MSIIDKLKGMTPQGRAKFMAQQYEKNRKFFRKQHPSIGRILDHYSSAPYSVQVDDDFFIIINKETGEKCHPEAGLDRFAEMLGDWTNNAWIDIIEERLRIHQHPGKYSQYPTRFQERMLTKFPGLFNRIHERQINLPTLASGKRFSNSVAFVGIFHGLHIDYFLSRTQVHNAAFIEPDANRFVVSCGFLDYEELERRFNGLILYVGNDFPDRHVDVFLNKAAVSGAVWVRILPGYASEKIEPLLRQLRLKCRNVHDIRIPPEQYFQGMRNAMVTIERGGAVCRKKVALSSASRIAVVGSGPSLAKDLPWLAQHADQFVVFAAHSAVSALEKYGIRPDFQFNIETREWDEKVFERLQLRTDVPIVTLLGDMPDKFAAFDDVLMLPASVMPDPVAIGTRIHHTHPTTGNTALAFACYCAPSEVYLFGFDFGYRRATETHVAESSAYVDDADQKSQLGRENLPVPANFPDAETVYTQPYFNVARQSAEAAVASINDKGTQFFNCSDGSRVRGADPLHSDQIELRTYDKTKDIELIRSVFGPLEQGVDWNPFEFSGEDLLEKYKKAFLQQMGLGNFSWHKFAKQLDYFEAGLAKRLPKKMLLNGDQRIYGYLALVKELLIIWYRFVCFTNNEEEWNEVYSFGYEVLADLINDMHWDDFDRQSMNS